MEIDKEDIKWILSLIIPIAWELIKNRKKKTPNPKRPSKKKRS